MPETGQTKRTPAPGVGSCCGRERNGSTGYILVGMHPPLALVFWGIDAGRTALIGPKASSLGQRLGAVGSGSCGQGLTGLLFASFFLRLPPPAWAQCLVWKGPPRIGQVSAHWLLTSPSPAGFPRPGYQGAKGHVFSCRPLRPRCRGH